MADENITEDVQEEPSAPLQDKNPLELSDEEILKLSPEAFKQKNEADEEDSSDEEVVKSPEDDPQEEVKTPDTTFEGGEDVEEPIEEVAEAEQPPEQSEEKTEEDTKKSEDSSIDYKGEYERLLAPFNAAGQEVQVKSVDEAIRLMQQGVGFHKKNAAIKDLKRKIQPLEDFKLLTDENISLFIDLIGKKDKNALNKLINDFGVDPLDINTDDSSEYKPNTYTADESRLELDEVLDELRTSPHYTNILDIVGNRWDAQSKQTVAENPRIMRDLEQHMKAGIYEVVSKEVERRRMFGEFTGVGDLAAYNQVGQELRQSQQQQAQQAPAVPPQQPVITQTNGTNPELNQKRKAAGTTKSMPSGQTAPQTNPLSMSDEDFLKAGF